MKSKEEKYKALVLEAFDTHFDKCGCRAVLFAELYPTQRPHHRDGDVTFLLQN